jgi:hemoglobin
MLALFVLCVPALARDNGQYNSVSPEVSAGGPMYYRGRDMVLTHRGMRISDSDWNVFLGHAAATLAKFQVPEAEQRDVVAFVQSLKKECVEC